MGKELKSFEQLKEMDKDLYENSKEVINVNGYDIEVYTKFRPSSIQDMITEILEKQEGLEKLKFDTVTYGLMLYIKYFTNLKSVFPSKLEEEVTVFQYLTETGIFEAVYNVFNDKCLDEIEKANKAFLAFSENLEVEIKKLQEEKVNNDNKTKNENKEDMNISDKKVPYAVLADKEEIKEVDVNVE